MEKLNNYLWQIVCIWSSSSFLAVQIKSQCHPDDWDEGTMICGQKSYFLGQPPPPSGTIPATAASAWETSGWIHGEALELPLITFVNVKPTLAQAPLSLSLSLSQTHTHKIALFLEKYSKSNKLLPTSKDLFLWKEGYCKEQGCHLTIYAKL